MNDAELIVDSFAGGGGASLGLAWATGRAPDIAINHDQDAIDAQNQSGDIDQRGADDASPSQMTREEQAEFELQQASGKK